MRTSLFPSALLALVLTGCCGYSTRSLLPTYLKTIHIGEVKNRTLRPLLAEDLNDELIAFFTRDGRLRVTPDASADLVLTIDITAYNRTASVYTAEREISEYKYELRFTGNCTDQIKNTAVWEGSDVAFKIIDANVDEEEGIRQLLESAAELIVRDVQLAW